MCKGSLLLPSHPAATAPLLKTPPVLLNPLLPEGTPTKDSAPLLSLSEVCSVLVPAEGNQRLHPTPAE